MSIESLYPFANAILAVGWLGYMIYKDFNGKEKPWND